MVTILVVLVCVTILAFSLHAAASCLLRRYRRRLRHDDQHETPEEEKGKSGREAASPEETLPSLVYTAGTRLAGAAAECAICLAEFAEGERVRVLPACNHGFHVKCVQAWLATGSSCPTCRTPASGDLPEEP
ncbi:RING-H2 finger protein ATL79-like [Phoenix dactylifera]|uniref:RING-H2 finger protein ATL79-like n=1 Tax=Phoenix dactylifera TaxID=42345 RepID=A0A8B8J766_PHODC|nr:RING-H2 finger protein ATL79-like [Phoenix dactylifera]